MRVKSCTFSSSATENTIVASTRLSSSCWVVIAAGNYVLGHTIEEQAQRAEGDWEQRGAQLPDSDLTRAMGDVIKADPEERFQSAAAMGAALSRFRAEGGFNGPRADLLLGTFLALVAFNVAALFENNWGDSEVQRLVLFVLAVPFVSVPGPSTPRAAILPSP